MSSKTVHEGLVLEDQTCVGCCACCNICPVNAIKMDLDEQGFSVFSIDRFTCISCNECAEVCPQINPVFDNDHEPRCYSVKANDPVIGESSFGGVLSLLCNTIISRGGFLCGPVFDPKMNVTFKITDDISELKRIQDTLYVPNDLGNIYKTIREKLNLNKPIMFIGCPCQVAGVRNFIGKNKNLITVDLLCEGLPSKGLYLQYLKEISEGKEIKDIQFHPAGCSAGSTLIKFNDGSEKIQLDDPYVNTLLNDLIKYDACAECIYADTPRPGDISIGDLRNTEKMTDGTESPKNVGCVMLNNDTGKTLFDRSIKSAAQCVDIPLPILMRDKRLQQIRPQPPARQRLFFMLGRKHPLLKSIEYTISRKYDVGITGFWRVQNYGGVLTYYALYKLILDLGLEPLMLEARYKVEEGATPSSPVILGTKYPPYHVSRYYTSIDDEKELNNRVSKFVVGSDQVWNRSLIRQTTLECFALDFVVAPNKRVSISSSFGVDHLEGIEKEQERFINLLKKFNSVSVRENGGVELCKKHGVNATRILDPVMLCDNKHYMDMIASSEALLPTSYAFYYLGNIMSTKLEIIAEKMGYGVIKIRRKLGEDKTIPITPITEIGTVENWVKCIYNSSFVVSDSYHATVFAILFRKPFVLFYGNMSGGPRTDRFATLLDTFGLNDRMYKNIEDLSFENIMKPIDYDRVHKILESERERSMKWIREALLDKP